MGFLLVDPERLAETRGAVEFATWAEADRHRGSHEDQKIYISEDDAVDFCMMMKEDHPLWIAWKDSTMMVPSDVPVAIAPDTSRSELEFQIMCLASVDQARSQIEAKIAELRGECGIGDDPEHDE